jgi:hypothetical protein
MAEGTQPHFMHSEQRMHNKEENVFATGFYRICPSHCHFHKKKGLYALNNTVL